MSTIVKIPYTDFWHLNMYEWLETNAKDEYDLDIVHRRETRANPFSDAVMMAVEFFHEEHTILFRLTYGEHTEI